MSVIQRTFSSDPLASHIQVVQSVTRRYDTLRDIRCLYTEKLLVQDPSTGQTVTILPGGASGLAGTDPSKLPLAGGTMTGAIAMSTNKITGMGDPTAAQDAATKNYVDTVASGSGGFTFNDINTSTALAISNHYYVTAGATLTLTLPAAPANGSAIRISDVGGTFNTFNVTVTASGGDTILGSASIHLSVRYGFFELTYNAASNIWLIDQSLMEEHSTLTSASATVNLTPGVVHYLDTSGGVIAAGLPLVSTALLTTGDTITIVDVSGNFNTNNVTVSRSGADTIQQAGQASQTSFVMSTNYQMVTFRASGTSTWIVESQNVAASGSFLPLTGGIMTGNITMSSNQILSIARANQEIENKGTLVANDLLTSTSKNTQYYVDGASFAVDLPNATTLPNGWRVTLIGSTSNTILFVRNFLGVNFGSIVGEYRGYAILLDNSTSSGVWYITTNQGPASDPPASVININATTTLSVGTEYHVDTSGGAFGVTMPAAPADGACIRILDTTGLFVFNNLTVNRGGTDTFEGGLTAKVLNQQNMIVEFTYDAGLSQWLIAGKVFVGATGVAPGLYGLVPAPVLGDQNAVLVGDSTWSRLPISKLATINATGNLEASTRYAVDTSGASFIVNLPDSASTTIGSVVELLDAKQSFNTNNLIVARQGTDQIYQDGLPSATSVTLNVDNTHRRFVLGESLKWFVEAAPASTGSANLNVANVTADPAPAVINNSYHCNTSGGVFNFTLPTSPADGSRIQIIDANGSFNTNNLTVLRGGTDTIEGSTSLVLSTNHDVIDLYFEAGTTDWKVSGLSSGGGGGGGLTVSNITADPAPGVISNSYHANTSGGAFNLTLPTSPADGSQIQIIDANGSFATNNLTVLRGGTNTIEGATSLVLNTNHDVIDLYFEAGTGVWKVAGLTASASTSFNGLVAPVEVKTVAALPTYTQAGAGVGATLTATANGAFPAVDGITLSTVGDRILVDSDGSAAAADNGIYTLTQVGDGSNPWILTRATDYDEASEITYGSHVVVIQGTVCAGCIFVLSGTAAITVDTTALNFVRLPALTDPYSLNNFEVINSNTTVTTRGRYLVDTTGGIVTITMPNGVTPGEWMEFIDANRNFHNNHLQLNGSGDMLFDPRETGVAVGGYTLNVKDTHVVMTYLGSSTWARTTVAPVPIQGEFKTIAAATNLLPDTKYNVSTGGGSFIVTLPEIGTSGVPFGTEVEVFDGGSNWASNPLTVQRAGTDNIYIPNDVVFVTSVVLSTVNDNRKFVAVNGNRWIMVDNNTSPTSITVVNVTADPNPAIANREYHLNTSGGAFNFTLPSGPSDGAFIRIIDSNGSFATNNLTVLRGGTDTIEGATSLVLDTNHQVVEVYFEDATNDWKVFGLSASSGGGLTVANITADPAPAVVSTSYHANTSGGAFTITLPTSPADGSHIQIMDANNTFGSNNLTVARGGTNTIRSGTSLTLSTLGQVVDLYFEASTNDWKTSQADVLTGGTTLHYASVEKNTGQSFTTTSYVKVGYDAVTLDVGGLATASSDPITIVQDGVYQVYGHLKLNSPTPGEPDPQLLYAIHLNNAVLYLRDNRYSGGNLSGANIELDGTAHFSELVSLSAGDTIDIRCKLDVLSSSTINVLDGALNVIQIPTTAVATVSAAAEFLHANGSTGGSQNNISVSDRVTLDTIAASSGSSISLAGSIFTLAAGKTYKLYGHTRLDPTTPSGDITYTWYNITGSTAIGNTATIYSVDNGITASSNKDVIAIISPTVTTTVEMRITFVAVANMDLDANNSIALVEVISDTSKVSTMSGSSSGSAGVQGLVPTPAAGDQNATLVGDATWSRALVTKSSTITADPSPAIYGTSYMVDTSGGAFNFTLPDSTGLSIGVKIEVYDNSGNFAANNLTVQRSGTDQIFETGAAGVNSLVLNSNNDKRTFTLVASGRWSV